MERAVERLLAAMDAMDGDPDFEPMLGAGESGCWPSDQRRWIQGGDTDEREAVSEDEGAQCEGEGDHDEREPEVGDMCNWQDEGDQTTLRQLPVYSMRRGPRSRRR